MSGKGSHMNGNGRKAAVIAAERFFDFPVFPEFRTYDRKNQIPSAGPWFCEDDKGRIAFVSEEAREAFKSQAWNKEV